MPSGGTGLPRDGPQFFTCWSVCSQSEGGVVTGPAVDEGAVYERHRTCTSLVLHFEREGVSGNEILAHSAFQMATVRPRGEAKHTAGSDSSWALRVPGSSGFGDRGLRQAEGRGVHQVLFRRQASGFCTASLKKLLKTGIS